jgi:hypothetical protein
MRKPKVGDTVRCLPSDYGPELVHICTVTDLLDTQFTATYEVQRGDGGWQERTLFRFYKDENCTWEQQK